MAERVIEHEIKHGHFFCGLGGGARGFNRGTARVGNMVAKFRCIGGIDVDAASIRDFEQLAGCKGTVLDLFSREQFQAFHGRKPPADWREALPDDIRRAYGGEVPDIVFLSAPCKGFSGLLSETASQTAKYRALNELTLRGIWLMLEAFQGDERPALIIFENVPRIMTRGRPLLDQIIGLLRHYGYVTAETVHDCGEIAEGGLAQSRKRFLLVARLPSKVPNFLYEPRKFGLRGVGEILGKLPLPGDMIAGGPMHRMPALQWKTWVRLAFVEAGSDWRSLNKLAVEDGFLRDFGILPQRTLRNGALGVTAWEEACGLVAGESFPTNGSYAVADPRSPEFRQGFLGVRGWDEATGVVAARAGPTNGAHAVADPRVDGHEKSVQLGVRPWGQPAAVVKGDVSVGTGPYAVSDPRVGQDGPRFNHAYRIIPWSSPGSAVTSAHGALAAVSDPRPSDRTDYKQTKYRVTRMDEPAGTAIAASSTGNGAFAVADPRATWGADSHRNKLKVVGYDQKAPTIMGADRVGSGALSADPRHPGLWGEGQLGVNAWGDHTGVLTSARSPLQGAFSVADPRPESMRDGRDRYLTQGHYGVVGWDEHGAAVTASGQHDNGRWAVADPRPDHVPGAGEMVLPAPSDRLVCIIRALDDTWHRPFTTLELAALQSLFDPDDLLERPFALDGVSDSGWRERIGNAVPSASAQAIASVMGRTLLLARAGETFSLSAEPIWVNPNRPLEIALSVNTGAALG